MWWWVLVACHGPSATGPSGMVGRVLGPDGAPVAGIVVQSVEAEARTDADGAFRVAWKEPDTHLFFERAGVIWHRSLRPDDPPVVELRLPPTEPRELGCGTEADTVRLEWAISPGWVGRVVVGCEPGASAALRQVPLTAPRGTCAVGTRDVPCELVERPGGWDALPMPTPLRVELHALEGAVPTACRVEVDGLAATPDGVGFWVGRARGEALVTVVCEGRPAWPARATPGSGSIGVDWSPDGPVLDLEGVVPEATAVELRAEGARDWLIAAPGEDGLVALPPMSAGTWRVRVVTDATAASGSGGYPEPGAIGVLVLARADGGWRGTLVLASDAVSGPIRVAAP